ncbi:MAG: hypothetical protein GEU75_16110 [Dehalococcoidia bacterium]|nr:hypothetical protein [Dehalococcoidia bacterium]
MIAGRESQVLNRSGISREPLSEPRGVRSILAEAVVPRLGRINSERLQFLHKLGYLPHLQRPRNLNEKICAMKLFADLPAAPMLADKAAVRDYVARVAGEKYLNELYQIADRAEDIDWARLPNAFAARTTHGSGMNVLVRDKSREDLGACQSRLSNFLRRRYGRLTNEWWYSRIKPRIVIERFLADEKFELPRSYNFYCFHGRVQFIRLVDHVKNEAPDFYDRDWNMREFYFARMPRGPHVAPPSRLGEMIEIAEALAGELEFVRVDLFRPNDERVVFNEMTLAPGAGWDRIEPRGASEYIGSFW